MKYGHAIKIVRTAHGLSQADLADHLSIGPSQLSLIEGEKRKPSLGVLEEIATALDVPAHLLMLLASGPEQMTDDADPKQVADLARALFAVLARSKEQLTLPMSSRKKAATRPVAKKRRRKVVA